VVAGIGATVVITCGITIIKHNTRTGNTRGIIVIRLMAFVPAITKTFSNMSLGIIGFTELINAIS